MTQKKQESKGKYFCIGHSRNENTSEYLGSPDIVRGKPYPKYQRNIAYFS